MRSIAKRAAAFLALFVWLAVLIPPISCAGDPDPLRLTILHMNDPHAHYMPYRDQDTQRLIGGFAKAETIISEVDQENLSGSDDTLIFMAGDLLTGTPYSTAFKGKLGVKLMNEMRFTAMVVGNHDFDFGLDNLLGLKSAMHFPLLSANIRTDKEQYVFERVVVKKYQEANTRVVILGLTTADTPQSTLADNVRGIVFEDPVKTATEILKDFHDNDLVIALTHIGIEEDKKLAQACPKIDVIIGGHSHTELREPLKVGNAIICQAGAYAKYLGRLDLEAVEGKIVKYSGKLIFLGPEVKEDKKIASILDEYKKKMDAGLNVEIGSSEVFLDGKMRDVRSGHSTNLGRLIAYVLCEAAEADLALVNGGAIRESIRPGPITVADVNTALPFQNSAVRVELSGDDLAAVLQRSAEMPEGRGGKLQTFGVDFRIEDGKVRVVHVKGRSFDPAATYVVAINDFLLKGGDGYTLFQDNGKNATNLHLPVTELLIEFIKRNKVITSGMLDRLMSTVP